MSELVKWVEKEISCLIQCPVGEDMAKCVLMIESNRDLQDYLSSILDISNSKHLEFMKELMRRKAATSTQGYKKTQLDDYIQTKPLEGKKKRGKGEKMKAEAKAEQKEEISQGGNDAKKKTKFVSLYSAEAPDVILLKGRHICNCQASKHKLINNCLKCGRIVCEQEGPGPCFFCNSIVKWQHDDMPVLTSNEAVELKDRLLEFDRTSEKRTKVIDDESDYFSSNSVWLSKEQKADLKKKEEELQNLKHTRGKSKLHVDFTGRYVIENDLSNVFNVEDSLVEDISELLNTSAEGGTSDIDPNFSPDIKPIYSGSNSIRGSKWHNDVGRVQDKHVMEMTDSGMCLSMHQPWASLLVTGIKRHEGRSWYTSHRGRLWIASTAKVPSSEDIEPILEMYRALRGDSVKLPKKFPPGVLLGCVTLSDCLAQEDYVEQYPDGESGEPFVFICEDPIICPVMFPMKGQHKIYKLETKIHQAAVKCIQKMAKLK